MEHLAIALRSNPDIHGIRIADSSYKFALYADGLLVYVTDPLISLPMLSRKFDALGALSNFKVNLQKSDMLNVTLSSSLATTFLSRSFPVKWQDTAIKYLSTHIYSRHPSLFHINLPLLNSLKSDLRAWSSLPLSWFGRLNVLKMGSLPKLLYIFQTLPTSVSRAFFHTLHKKASSFMWRHGRPGL